MHQMFNLLSNRCQSLKSDRTVEVYVDWPEGVDNSKATVSGKRPRLPARSSFGPALNYHMTSST